jgi:hypothetical protein
MPQPAKFITRKNLDVINKLDDRLVKRVSWMIPGLGPSGLSKTPSNASLEPLAVSKRSFGGFNLDTGHLSIPEETNFIKKSMKDLDAIDHANPFQHLAKAEKEKIFSSRNIRSFEWEAASFIDKTSMNHLPSDKFNPEIPKKTAAGALRRSIMLQLPRMESSDKEASRRSSIMPIRKMMQSPMMDNLSTQAITKNL